MRWSNGDEQTCNLTDVLYYVFASLDLHNMCRYLSIVKDEGLEISQPALDIEKSEVHHLITARWRRSKIHRLVH